jgi:N6-adenosine-specific RNA methylase IME4
MNDVVTFAGVPAALKALDRLELQIQQAATFDALDDLANAAAGWQRRFKPVKGVSDRAGEVWIAAEVRLGQERAKMPKAKGALGNPGGRGAKIVRSQIGTAQAPTLAELKLDKKRAARAERLAALPDEERKALADELKAEDKAVTPNAVLALLRQRNKLEKKLATAVAAFSAEGPFDCVVIDPPWQVAKIDRDERPNQDAFDYPTMSEDEIAAFWKDEIADRLVTDCHLFLWTTHKYLPAALRLLAGFGFRYVLTMVWHKPGGFQPHDLPQYNCEFIIYGRRGSPLFIDTKNFFCCFSAPRREHSRKPDEFYDTIRRVTGGSRIDVFSREAREGFAQYGNEMGRFSSEAAE